jgi:hypothetical protein
LAQLMHVIDINGLRNKADVVYDLVVVYLT